MKFNKIYTESFQTYQTNEIEDWHFVFIRNEL